MNARTLFAASIRLLSAAALAAGLALPAHAQGYPARTVHLVVPFPPGGSTDIVARAFGEELQKRLGQPFVVENRPGASGSIGIGSVARAAADGYTLLVTSNTLVTTPALNRKLPYDVLKDFAPVSLVADMPIALAAVPSLPGANLAEAIAHIKSHPGKYNYGSAGIGAPQHLTTEYLRALAGIDIIHVPLQGQGPMINEMLGDRVHLSFLVLSTAKPHFERGSLRSLGVAGAQRSPLAPGEPTIAEGGVTGFAVSWWQGLLAPAGTPAEVVQLLEREIREIGRQPAFHARLVELGLDFVGSTPAEFGRAIENDLKLWTRIADDAGLVAK
ncbi:tripartite tricarboxylate transporter substrate binding protein [Pseudothauera rhizosphaerae]|uniref:Tripartite tricarboxylate transporter substrate binding protein n=1 Tax=Pseudothauera rhizosphaerae TaxID=2565932 RepID=A0A4S4B0T8_9RHOO|nr:tripartite tricarboxylate transporter substrate binding protein [Pseudothauera rhizosphaerae]THF65254.1 tripartite tricarboxylate transporter substrate binding protein [Pseudothauera rhizosphaerae]